MTGINSTKHECKCWMTSLAQILIDLISFFNRGKRHNWPSTVLILVIIVYIHKSSLPLTKQKIAIVEIIFISVFRVTMILKFSFPMKNQFTSSITDRRLMHWITIIVLSLNGRKKIDNKYMVVHIIVRITCNVYMLRNVLLVFSDVLHFAISLAP